MGGGMVRQKTHASKQVSVNRACYITLHTQGPQGVHLLSLLSLLIGVCGQTGFHFWHVLFCRLCCFWLCNTLNKFNEFHVAALPYTSCNATWLKPKPHSDKKSLSKPKLLIKHWSPAMCQMSSIEAHISQSFSLRMRLRKGISEI